MKSIVSEAICFMLFITRHIRRGDVKAGILALLIELGFHSNADGFNYLRDAIYLKATRPYLRFNDVCVELAKNCEYPISYRQIDQAIRTLIDATWINCDLEKWSVVLPQGKSKQLEKPTNSVFVAQIACVIELWISGVERNDAE